MNIKKLFAILAGVSMIAQTVVPAGVSAATYSQELQDAYDWAYGKGVTTMSSIDNANMYGAITRAEMAKMLSVYATEVLGREADASKSCIFTDIDSVKGDLHDYIIKSCQLGLMGQGITAFRPYDTISRAEFGTALSRTLFGDKYEGGVPYYANHLNALKAAGIMNQISNAESMKEVRGYVMLMLMRSEGGSASEKADCDDPAIALACSLESDSCPAECKTDSKKDEDEVVKSGSLIVSVADDSSKVVSVPREGIVTIASVDLDTDESITLDNITVSKVGLSSKTDVKSVWFEKDGVRVSGKASLASDGTASISFNNGLTVKSSDTIDLVAELAAQAGSELQFEITKVSSSAKDYSIKGGMTPTYRTVNYTVANVNVVAKGNNAEYKLGDQDSYEIAKFNIENNNNAADDKDVRVESIILKNVGTADLENLDHIVVYRDSKKVSDKVTVNGKNLEIALNDVIESGKKGIYTIEANVTYVDRSEGDTYILSLNKTADLVAYEESTNMRVTLNVNAPLNMATYTVKGGKMVLATASDSPKTVDAGISYSDVVLAEGTLTVAEPIKLENLVLNANVTAGTNPLSKILKKARLEIGNSSYTAIISGTQLIFDNEMYISKTSKVKVTVDIASTANNGDQISIDPIKGGAFVSSGEYQNSSNSFAPAGEVAGSVTIAKLTIKAAKFNMTKTSKSSEIKVVETVNDEVSVFNGKITNNQNSDLTVNDLTLDFAKTAGNLWTNNEEIYFTLKIGDKTVSKAYKNKTATGDIVFSSLGINLAKDEAVDFEILASATTVATQSVTTITINAKATGTDANGNESVTNDVFVATYKVVNAGSATVAKSSVVNSAFTQNTDGNVIAQWTLTVKDEDLNVKKITIDYDNAASTVISNNALNTWKVVYGDKELNGSLSKATGKLIMEDLNERLQPGTYTFKAIANFGSITNGSEALVISGVIMDLQGVNPINASTSATYTHAVLKAVPVISFVKTRESDNDVSKYFAVKISNPQSNEESITLSGFTFGGTNSGNVKVTYGDNRDTFASGAVVLAPGTFETIYFEAATPLSGGTSFDFSLTNVEYVVDNSLVSNLKNFNNVVTWADLKVSGRITQ